MNAPVNPFDLSAQSAAVQEIGPGFYQDLTNQAYHSGPGISKSGLDYIAHSPSAYAWSRTAPVHQEKLKAMDFGTALHTMLLEPHEFDNQFAVAPELNLRTNAGKAEMADFTKAHGHKIIMTYEDREKLDVMLGSVQEHPVAKWIFEQDGINEASIYWTDKSTNELCRVRPDRILTDHHIIVDVKKVDGMERFQKHVEEFRYHVQDGMYSEGYEQHFGHEPQFLFLAVSSTVSAGRYQVDVFDLEHDWKLRGKELFRDNLETYHRCRVENDWLHIKTLDRPGWAVRQDERRFA